MNNVTGLAAADEEREGGKRGQTWAFYTGSKQQTPTLAPTATATASKRRSSFICFVFFRSCCCCRLFELRLSAQGELELGAGAGVGVVVGVGGGVGVGGATFLACRRQTKSKQVARCVGIYALFAHYKNHDDKSSYARASGGAGVYKGEGNR